jgi:hypothetical protein
MNIVDIALIAIIILVICMLINNNKNKIDNFSNNNNEQYDNTHQYTNNKTRNRKHSKKVRFADDYLDKIIDFTQSDCNKNNPNSYFQNIQFHNDYRDVMSAFNIISPDQKQIFNMANVPIQVSIPKNREINSIISDFIRELNYNIKNEISDKLSINSGWNSPMPDKNMESGWDKIQKSLGLPTSVYNDPAPKSKVKLVKIDTAQKEETENEIKYLCNIILQKQNVSDQMVIQISFVMNKEFDDERNILEPKAGCKIPFTPHKNGTKSDVIIEQIFIVGFLSSSGMGINSDSANEDHYNFDKLERSDIVDPKFVMKEVERKYEQRTRDMNKFNGMLDDEGQEFHQGLTPVNGQDFSYF